MGLGWSVHLRRGNRVMADMFGDIFRQLGLNREAKQFWALVRSGKMNEARAVLAKIEQVASRRGKLRAIAGTLSRMQGAVRTALTEAGVTTGAAGDAAILTEEAGEVLAAGAEAGEVVEAGAAVAASAFIMETVVPIVAVVLVVLLLVWAASKAAGAEPSPTKRPLAQLPASLNPARKLSQQAPRARQKLKEIYQKNCICNTSPAPPPKPGKPTAAANLPVKLSGPCRWPNCAKKPMKSA